jgi:hypothetical protein
MSFGYSSVFIFGTVHGFYFYLEKSDVVRIGKEFKTRIKTEGILKRMFI